MATASAGLLRFLPPRVSGRHVPEPRRGVPTRRRSWAADVPEPPRLDHVERNGHTSGVKSDPSLWKSLRDFHLHCRASSPSPRQPYPHATSLASLSCTCADVMLTTLAGDETTQPKGIWWAELRHTVALDPRRGSSHSPRVLPRPGDPRRVRTRPLRSDGTVTGLGGA